MVLCWDSLGVNVLDVLQEKQHTLFVGPPPPMWHHRKQPAVQPAAQGDDDDHHDGDVDEEPEVWVMQCNVVRASVLRSGWPANQWVVIANISDSCTPYYIVDEEANSEGYRHLSTLAAKQDAANSFEHACGLRQHPSFSLDVEEDNNCEYQMRLVGSTAHRRSAKTTTKTTTTTTTSVSSTSIIAKDSNVLSALIAVGLFAVAGVMVLGMITTLSAAAPPKASSICCGCCSPSPVPLNYNTSTGPADPRSPIPSEMQQQYTRSPMPQSFAVVISSGPLEEKPLAYD